MLIIKINKKGFTLIELLVVISIIGLLSSIVMSSISTAKMKARDVRRIQDLKQIQIALELYRNTIGNYPYQPTLPTLGSYPSWNATFENNLKPYISKLPTDPINNSGSFLGANVYQYYYSTASLLCKTGGCYDLAARLEDPTNPNTCLKKQYTRAGGNSPWCPMSRPAFNTIYSPIIK